VLTLTFECSALLSGRHFAAWADSGTRISGGNLMVTFVTLNTHPKSDNIACSRKKSKVLRATNISVNWDRCSGILTKQIEP
jgi:hypothetical protein